jgi:energy-coupling factor transporter transmembrane protein EcfT
LDDRQDLIKVPRFGANCRFGLLLAAACAIVFVLSERYGTQHSGWLFAAIILLLIAVAVPRILAPLRRLWLKVGGFLHVVISPVLLAGFYFLAIVPVGVIMQLLGKDPLRRKRHPGSYWLKHDPPVADPRTMTELF